MQPVKPHSAAFDQGQQLAMNSHSVSKPPPVHSLLPLSALSHTHAFWLTAPLLLFLSLGGLLEPLFAWGSAASQKAESLQLIGMSAPSGWHSGSYTAPSSLFLHFLPLPPLLFSRYTCHTKNRGQCTNLPRAIASLRTVGFLPDEGNLRVLSCVLQGPPTFKGNSKSQGEL